MKRKIIGIVAALLVGLGVAVAVEAPAQAFIYPNRVMMGSLCLEAPAPGVPGDQLRLNTCNGSSRQTFLFEDAGFDWGYFIYPANTGLCLMPGSPSLFNSTIIQWPCSWGNTQTWVLGTANDSRRILYTTFNHWCIGVDSAFVGAYVRQASCDTPGRRWVVG